MRQVTLDPGELSRYGRQVALPQLGRSGQERLKGSTVTVVGAGGLGSPIALYLAAAGVGRIRLIDDDRVEVSNLQRQVLYRADDVGRDKVLAARERLATRNPHVEIEPLVARLDAASALALLRGSDVVLDGTDNLPTRYAINDACARLGIPFVFGSVFRFEGQVAVFRAGHGPCYRCVHPVAPAPEDVPDCTTAGVLGVVPGIVGCLQAAATLHVLLGTDVTLTGRLMLIDAWTLSVREVKLSTDRRCPTCTDRSRGPGVEAPRQCSTVAGISPADLLELLERGTPLTLLDVRTAMEREWARLPRDTWIPLDELDRRSAELDPRCDTVVYCHTGVRSAAAVYLLATSGFRRVLNLEGGIDAWSRLVDPTVPRY